LKKENNCKNDPKDWDVHGRLSALVLSGGVIAEPILYDDFNANIVFRQLK